MENFDHTPSILDLGGSSGDHIVSVLGQDFDRSNVMIADVDEAMLKIAREKHGFKTTLLKDENELPFKDQEFDIVFCSSVIEHATGPKDQVTKIKNTSEFEKISIKYIAQFANEIRRVGKAHFVQTPNKYFIIESHTWQPVYIVMLPRFAQIAMINLFNKFWPKKTSADWKLLTKSDMTQLFPESSIASEHSMGMTKSLIAIGPKETVDAKAAA